MAAFVRTRIDRNFVDKPRGDQSHYYGAMSGETDAGRRSRSKYLLGAPDFVIEGTTDTNTAALNAGAEQSSMLNLTSEGVTFPAGFDRDIDIIVKSRDESSQGNYQHIRQTVRGGTNPTLVNGVRSLGPKVGGRITFATAAATAADAYGGFSITAAATATGRYAAAIPKARRVIPTAMHVTLVGTGDLSAVATSMHLNALALATGVIELGFREGLDANVAPGDTVQAVFEADVLPVENPELAIVTSTSPDQVIVGAVGQASENVEWYAEIYIGDCYRNDLATASE